MDIDIFTEMDFLSSKIIFDYYDFPYSKLLQPSTWALFLHYFSIQKLGKQKKSSILLFKIFSMLMILVLLGLLNSLKQMLTYE